MLTPDQIRVIRIRARDIKAIWAMSPTCINLSYGQSIYTVSNNSSGYSKILKIIATLKDAQLDGREYYYHD